MIAANARQIVEMRKHGKQPAQWILVSFIGRIENEDNGATVYAMPDRDYDWRWVVGLELIAFARQGQAVAQQLKAIRNECPKTLSLWDVDLKTGAQVYFNFPEKYTDAHRKLTNKTMGIELLPWFSWQTREFVRMGF